MKGQGFVKKCLFQNYPQMFNIGTWLDLTTDDEFFWFKCIFAHMNLYKVTALKVQLFMILKA